MRISRLTEGTVTSNSWVVVDDGTTGGTKKVKASALAGQVNAPIPITYSELATLKSNGQMEAGRYYRITDYTCVTPSANTEIRSAGHRFDIIVMAVGPSQLEEEALAIRNANDSTFSDATSGTAYFANSDLDSWQLRYCLDNDTTRFAWADSTNGKGVIYWMKDEFGNEAPYDFKNIQFKRYRREFYNTSTGNFTDIYTFSGDVGYEAEITGSPSASEISELKAMAASFLTDYYPAAEDFFPTYTVSNEAGWMDFSFTANSGYKTYFVFAVSTGKRLSFKANPTSNYIWAYTFSSTSKQYLSVVLSSYSPATMDNNYFSDGSVTHSSNDTYCYSNIIKPYFEEIASRPQKQLLNNIVMFLYNNRDSFSNYFGPDCYEITLGPDCSRNIFEGKNNGIISSRYCNNNEIGLKSYYIISEHSNNNKLEAYSNNITLSSASSNIFGKDCSYIYLSKFVEYNSFDLGSHNISLGYDSQGNTFGKKTNFIYLRRSSLCIFNTKTEKLYSNSATDNTEEIYPTLYHGTNKSYRNGLKVVTDPRDGSKELTLQNDSSEILKSYKDITYDSISIYLSNLGSDILYGNRTSDNGQADVSLLNNGRDLLLGNYYDNDGNGEDRVSILVDGYRVFSAKSSSYDNSGNANDYGYVRLGDGCRDEVFSIENKPEKEYIINLRAEDSDSLFTYTYRKRNTTVSPVIPGGKILRLRDASGNDILYVDIPYTGNKVFELTNFGYDLIWSERGDDERYYLIQFENQGADLIYSERYEDDNLYDTVFSNNGYELLKGHYNSDLSGKGDLWLRNNNNEILWSKVDRTDENSWLTLRTGLGSSHNPILEHSYLDSSGSEKLKLQLTDNRVGQYGRPFSKLSFKTEEFKYLNHYYVAGKMALTTRAIWGSDGYEKMAEITLGMPQEDQSGQTITNTKLGITSVVYGKGGKRHALINMLSGQGTLDSTNYDSSRNAGYIELRTESPGYDAQPGELAAHSRIVLSSSKMAYTCYSQIKFEVGSVYTQHSHYNEDPASEVIFRRYQDSPNGYFILKNYLTESGSSKKFLGCRANSTIGSTKIELLNLTEPLDTNYTPSSNATIDSNNVMTDDYSKNRVPKGLPIMISGTIYNLSYVGSGSRQYTSMINTNTGMVVTIKTINTSTWAVSSVSYTILTQN